MEYPLVSVVLCTYNTAKYIESAINSVLSQTYNNFELIIWDDGSTDNTKEIVESYHDKRLRYYYHENTGLGMSLRLACDIVKGKYIARMDSDDVCLPERLEKEVVYMEEHDDCVLVSSAVYYIDENDKLLGRSFPCSEDGIIKSLLSKASNMIVHPMSMIRYEAYRKAGGYLPIRKSQDVLFWSRLAKQGKFYNISSPLGNYRLLNSSLDHSINPYRKVLMELLVKMVNDEVVSDTDIELYNNVFVYSKKYIKKNPKETAILKKNTLEEFFYSLLSPVIGNKRSEKLIVFVKNIYFKRKLHI